MKNHAGSRNYRSALNTSNRMAQLTKIIAI